MTASTGDSDRITHRFWRAGPGQGSINRLVFTRDATLGLVPIGGRSHERPQFAVRVDGGAAAEQAVVSFLGRESIHRWLAETVCDFVEEVAKLLAEYGEADYELVSAREEGATRIDGEAARHAQRHVELIPMQSLRSFGPLLVQLVARDGTDTSRRLIRVPRRKVFHIELPRSLGTPRAHRRMLRRLDRVERASRRFTVTSPTSVPKGYDYGVAQRASESEVIRLTRRWGVLPFLQPKNMTGYFLVAGEIYHRRTQAVLRDHIVNRLNTLLRAEGLAEIRVEGLPSVTDIDRILAELAAGRIDLKQASDATRF